MLSRCSCTLPLLLLTPPQQTRPLIETRALSNPNRGSNPAPRLCSPRRWLQRRGGCLPSQHHWQSTSHPSRTPRRSRPLPPHRLLRLPLLPPPLRPHAPPSS